MKKFIKLKKFETNYFYILFNFHYNVTKIKFITINSYFQKNKSH